MMHPATYARRAPGRGGRVCSYFFLAFAAFFVAGLAADLAEAFFAGASFAGCADLPGAFGLGADPFFTAFAGRGVVAGADLALVIDLPRAARVLAARAAFSSSSNSAGVTGRADLRSRSMS